MENKTLAFSAENIDYQGRTVEGYAAAFGNVDLGGDIIHRGAFVKTLNERGNKVKFLWQHLPTEPLGKILEMREDPRGLFMKAVISDTARGRDALALLKDGAVDGLSIGYDSVKGGTDYTDTDGKAVRNLREIKLYEVSLVTHQMNPEASVTGMKADNDLGSEGKPWKVFERDGEFFVYKIDEDGDPVGKRLGKHGTREEAVAQLRALYASESADGKAEETGEEIKAEDKPGDVQPETKSGRVFAARNVKRIYNAIKTLHEALEDAGLPYPEPTEESPGVEPVEYTAQPPKEAGAQHEVKAGPVTPPTEAMLKMIEIEQHQLLLLEV